MLFKAPPCGGVPFFHSLTSGEEGTNDIEPPSFQVGPVPSVPLFCSDPKRHERISLFLFFVLLRGSYGQVAFFQSAAPLTDIEDLSFPPCLARGNVPPPLAAGLPFFVRAFYLPAWFFPSFSFIRLPGTYTFLHYFTGGSPDPPKKRGFL